MKRENVEPMRPESGQKTHSPEYAEKQVRGLTVLIDTLQAISTPLENPQPDGMHLLGESLTRMRNLISTLEKKRDIILRERIPAAPNQDILHIEQSRHRALDCLIGTLGMIYYSMNSLYEGDPNERSEDSAIRLREVIAAMEKKRSSFMEKRD